MAWMTAGLASAGALVAVMVRSSLRSVAAIVKGAVEQAGSFVARRIQDHVISGVTEQTQEVKAGPGSRHWGTTAPRQTGWVGGADLQRQILPTTTDRDPTLLGSESETTFL